MTFLFRLAAKRSQLHLLILVKAQQFSDGLGDRTSGFSGHRSTFGNVINSKVNGTAWKKTFVIGRPLIVPNSLANRSPKVLRDTLLNQIYEVPYFEANVQHLLGKGDNSLTSTEQKIIFEKMKMRVQPFSPTLTACTQIDTDRRSRTNILNINRDLRYSVHFKDPSRRYVTEYW